MSWNLNPGAIAFTGIQSDGTTNFSFVALTTIPLNTRIYFTDAGWVTGANNGFRDGPEGILFWRATADIPAGTIISYVGANTNGFFAASATAPITINTVTSGTGASVLTETMTAAPVLSGSGDQIIAFQVADGFDNVVGSSRTLGGVGSSAYQAIAAITTDGNTFSNAATANDTALPDGLIENYSAVAVGIGTPSAIANSGEIDNATMSLAASPGGTTLYYSSDAYFGTSAWENWNYYINAPTNWTKGDAPITPMTVTGPLAVQNLFYVGTAGNDTLTGTTLDETFKGGDGSDTLIGGGGQDLFYLDKYNLFAAQNDVVTDFLVNDDIVRLGTDGPGTFVDLAAYALRTVDAGLPYAGSAQIYRLFNGHEQTLTLAGVNISQLTAANFEFSNSFRPSYNGQFLTDSTIFGGVSDDDINGTYGNDLLVGGGSYFSADQLFGDQGNDTLDGGFGDTSYVGGVGFDRVIYRVASSLNMTSNFGLVTSTAGTFTQEFHDIELIVGSAFNDSLSVGTTRAQLQGGGGNDTLTGGTFATDTVVFTGNRAEYTAVGTASDFTITDGAMDRDAIDTVRNFEFAQFADGTVETSTLVCFLAGTEIRTVAGDVPIEKLAIGDLVVTADGRSMPVRFIGRQTVVTRFADAMTAQPIRIRAGALGLNTPARDLYTSPGHAMVIDGILVIASALVNGTTVQRMARAPERFTYYHIELDEHAVIFAEGAATETYCDNVPREVFDNAAEYAALYPDAKPIVQLQMPTAKSARQVPKGLRELIARRAAAMGAGFDVVSESILSANNSDNATTTAAA